MQLKGKGKGSFNSTLVQLKVINSFMVFSF